MTTINSRDQRFAEAVQELIDRRIARKTAVLRHEVDSLRDRVADIEDQLALMATQKAAP